MPAIEGTLLEMPCFKRDNGVMPKLGLGTFQSSGADCREAVRIALDLGCRHLDTARMYENEEQVGQGIKDAGVNRDEIFLTTKLQMGQLDHDGVIQSCEQSLQDLDLDYVDLLLIHWPEDDVPLSETLGAMAELKQAGQIRHLGISNFPVDWMNKAVEVSQEPIFCNQIEYHPYLDQTPVLNSCRGHGMALVAYSPLARGHVVDDEPLERIARKHQKTPVQVALRWLLQQRDVAAIPKGTGRKHIESDFDVFDFELDDEDMEAINNFDKGKRLIDPEFAPDWDA